MYLFSKSSLIGGCRRHSSYFLLIRDIPSEEVYVLNMFRKGITKKG